MIDEIDLLLLLLDLSSELQNLRLRGGQLGIPLFQLFLGIFELILKLMDIAIALAMFFPFTTALEAICLLLDAVFDARYIFFAGYVLSLRLCRLFSLIRRLAAPFHRNSVKHETWLFILISKLRVFTWRELVKCL